MIDLAPGHKLGLPLANPIILAAGTVGYGEALPVGLNPADLGAVVVGPILGSSRGGGDLPRMGETAGGLVLSTGLQNRGARDVMQSYAPLWSRLGCPLIAQLADTAPELIGRTARRVSGAQALYGLEVALPNDADEKLAARMVQAVVRNSELPVSAKVPLDRAELLAPAAVEGGASWLVIGQPPIGALLGHTPWDGGRRPVVGSIYGPLVFAAMLRSLSSVVRLQLDVPLVACGGIHTLDQAQQALDAGAAALQVDSAVWVEPGLPAWLAIALTGSGSPE